MNRNRLLDVVCPECRARNRVTQWEAIEADSDAALIQALMEGSLFEFTCRNCGMLITLEYSVQFRDRERRLVIWHEPPGGGDGTDRWEPHWPAWALRRVRDLNSFIELCRIWRNDLDDTVMLAIKHSLAMDIARQEGAAPLVCSYEDSRNDAVARWLDYAVWMPGEAEPRHYTVDATYYDKLRNQTAEVGSTLLPPGRWVDWDAKTADRLLRALRQNQI